MSGRRRRDQMTATIALAPARIAWTPQARGFSINCQPHRRLSAESDHCPPEPNVVRLWLSFEREAGPPRARPFEWRPAVHENPGRRGLRSVVEPVRRVDPA